MLRNTFGSIKVDFKEDGFYTEVNTYADLPPAAANAGRNFIVLQPTKILWLVNWHLAGFYHSDGVSWTYLGPAPETTSLKVGATTVVGAPVTLIAGSGMVLTPTSGVTGLAASATTTGVPGQTTLGGQASL